MVEFSARSKLTCPAVTKPYAMTQISEDRNEWVYTAGWCETVCAGVCTVTLGILEDTKCKVYCMTQDS